MNENSKLASLVQLSRFEDQLWTEPILEELDEEWFEDPQGPVLVGEATDETVKKMGRLFESSNRVVCIHPDDGYVQHLRSQLKNADYPSETYIVQASPDKLNYREERFDGSILLNGISSRKRLNRRLNALKRVTRGGHQLSAAVFLKDSFPFVDDILKDVLTPLFSTTEYRQIRAIIRREFIEPDLVLDLKGVEVPRIDYRRWQIEFADGESFIESSFVNKYFLGDLRQLFDENGIEQWDRFLAAIQTYWQEMSLRTTLSAAILYGHRVKT